MIKEDAIRSNAFYWNLSYLIIRKMSATTDRDALDKICCIGYLTECISYIKFEHVFNTFLQWKY